MCQLSVATSEPRQAGEGAQGDHERGHRTQNLTVFKTLLTVSFEFRGGSTVIILVLV